ncbi:DUF4376 domain-containing protein [Rhizorhabdus histidinilytica]|uniref:DUF4376 domain-containing protein n=1 Tax=Rhizorhabdus histidinilytica TaxID=439228 RepID=A0A1T5BWC5_9SPHN|nr:DUF4376 domain-containing protein [Rhizorhabdus histidinilytica]SKB51424.1 protein of unknown function [Rhizorhabdus histidinilytica]
MRYAHKDATGWHEIDGSFTIGEGLDMIQFAAGWPDQVTADMRAEVGLVEIVEPEAPAEHVRVLGSSLAGTSVPHRIWLTEPLPIEEARAIVWARAKDIRQRRAEGGCATMLGRVDTDPNSQSKITGYATDALAALASDEPFIVGFTMADDMVVTHDARAMIAMHRAVQKHLNACQEAAAAIRDAIQAADTAEAVFAVDIEAGYPA